MTSRVLRAAVAAVIVALTAAACGVSSPDPAACKAAIQAQYLKAQYLKTGAGKGHSGAEPALCKGLPQAEVRRFTQQVLQGK